MLVMLVEQTILIVHTQKGVVRLHLASTVLDMYRQLELCLQNRYFKSGSAQDVIELLYLLEICYYIVSYTCIKACITKKNC